MARSPEQGTAGFNEFMGSITEGTRTWWTSKVRPACLESGPNELTCVLAVLPLLRRNHHGGLRRGLQEGELAFAAARHGASRAAQGAGNSVDQGSQSAGMLELLFMFSDAHGVLGKREG